MVTRIGPKRLHRRQIFLKDWREHRGLTQEQLAERLETTKPTISRIENGKRDFTGAFLDAAAFALQCEPSDLISRRPDQPAFDQLLRSLNPEVQAQVIAIIETFRKTGT